ncbi:MAG: hypothetical protein KBD64_06990 [Gammaproteobacteria bacterium]|nr:hypothetical protein [Gammaproteobacteria bacterium]
MLTKLNLNQRTKNQLMFLAITGMFIFPIIASYLYYYFGHHQGAATNNGQLLSNLNINIDNLDLVLNKNTQDSDLYDKSKWRVLVLAPESCDTKCENIIYKLQQVHIALGRNVNRFQRTFIHSNFDKNLNNNWPEIYKKYPHMTAIWLEPDKSEKKSLTLDPNNIYLADPLGNIILSYSLNNSNYDSNLFKDTKKLLNLSKIG